jgi:ABC-type arginine transport system ATPase subunit
LAFPAAQIALQAVQMQIDIRSKENEAQITKLRKQLSVLFRQYLFFKFIIKFSTMLF